MSPRFSLGLVLAVFACGLAVGARAADLVWATGQVRSADGKRPLAGAIVAVYDDKNHVIDYAKTDSDGFYTLVMPRSALHLGKKDNGFFHQVFGGIAQFVGGVGKIAALPIKAGIKAAAAASTVSDPLTKVGIGAASNVAQTLVDTMAPPERGKKTLPPRFLPGALVMKVSLPGHNDVVSVARVYWMQKEIHHIGGKEQRALAAWFDPANLTSAGAEEPSTIASTFLTFTSARLEPSIAEPGQTVTLTVLLPTPPTPRTPVVVVARNSKTGSMFALSPVGDGVYQGEFVVDKRFPKDDQTLCVLAYPEQADHPGRSKKVEDALHGAGLWNPEKPFVYNPLLVVSRNRAEVTLTVVRPAKRR